MKKIVAILLTLIFCLCPLGTWAQEEKTYTPEECVALNHALYEANVLENLLSRHSSLTYTFINPWQPEQDGYNWLTSEEVFGVRGMVAEYIKDRVYYRMEPNGQKGAPTLQCGINFDMSFDPCYRIVGNSEEDFWTPEHDHLTGATERDGVICLNSQFDEVFSAKKVEEYGREYTGQVVTTHLEMDATTFEILRFYLCMDGEIFWDRPLRDARYG